jgi:hypothetical protein
VPGELLSPQRGAVLAVLVLALTLLVAARARGEAARLLVLLGWTLGLTCLLYLAGRSHGQAMGAKYLASAWPLLAFVPVLAVTRLPRRARGPVGVVGALALVTAGMTCGERWFERGDSRLTSPLISGADAVVVDTVRRGELPRVMLDLPPDLPVFAATQATVYREPHRWAAGMGRRTVWVSKTPRMLSTRSQRAALALALRRHHAVRMLPFKFPGLGELFVVTRGTPVVPEAPLTPRRVARHELRPSFATGEGRREMTARGQAPPRRRRG